MCALNYRTGTDGRECGNRQAPIHHQDWENNHKGMTHWWYMRHITCVHGRQCYTHTHTHTHTHSSRQRDVSFDGHTEKQEQVKKIGCSQNDSLFIHSTSTCYERPVMWQAQVLVLETAMRHENVYPCGVMFQQKTENKWGQPTVCQDVQSPKGKKKKTLRLSTGLGSVGGKMVK